MPNLLGIHAPETSAAARQADLARMIARVDLPGFGYTTARAEGADISAANVLTGIERAPVQPARDAGRGLWLMLDGEILGDTPLRSRLAELGQPCDGDDAALALAAYVALGEDFLDTLNGNWNLVLHDEGAASTLIASDRFGSRLLYLAEDTDRVTFGSEAKGVVAGRGRPSRAGGPGLVQLFAGSQHYGRSTWIEGLEVLDPGTVLRLDRRGRARRRYHVLRFEEGGPRMSMASYAEGFRTHLAEATARALRVEPGHAVAITLSGGLDSRSIAASVPADRRPIPALTYGDPDSADVRYARVLAERLGLAFEYVESERRGLLDGAVAALDARLGPARKAPRGFFSAQIDRLVWRDEIMGDIMGTASVLWHPLYSRRMNVMLNGACGDALTGSHLWPGLLRGPPRHEIVARLAQAAFVHDRALVRRVLRPDFLAEQWPRMQDDFRAMCAEIDADHPAAFADVWDMQNRQRRGTFSTFAVERHFCTVRAPYLDYDLAAHLQSVPFRWRFRQQVYKKMLVQSFPEIRDVPWAYTEGRITDNLAFELAREAALFARSRLSRLRPGGATTNRWDFRDAVALLRADPEISVAVEDWLDDSAFPGDVFDAAGIRALIRDFESGGGGEPEATIYGVLAGLARAHRWVLGGEALPPEADPRTFDVQPPAQLASG